MIPDYQTLMLPVLKSAKDKPVRTQDVIQVLADEFGLSALGHKLINGIHNFGER
jgi:restriction endonuclease Mrr